MDSEILTSRIAFLFLIFAVISGGIVAQTLPCQLQSQLATSSVARHSIGFLMVFVFLMMEGGWSFDPKDDELAPTDWSSGNTIHTLGIAAAIYTVFVLSSKMQLIPNLMFYGLLFITYVMITYKRFLKDRKRLSPKDQKSLELVNKLLLVALITVFVYGFTDYVLYQRQQHPTNFSWEKFIVGKPKCDSMKNS